MIEVEKEAPRSQILSGLRKTPTVVLPRMMYHSINRRTGSGRKEFHTWYLVDIVVVVPRVILRLRVWGAVRRTES